VAVLMLKAGIFSELIASFNSEPAAFPDPFAILVALIPVYSRFGLGMLFFLPFAKEDGLARTLGAARALPDRFILWAGYMLLGIAVLLSLGLKYFFVPLIGGAFLVFYGRYCVKVFGGITGDLLGTSVELSETLMLLTLVVASG